MTEAEQARAFSDDLDRLVNRYRQEFDISFASVVAALEFKKFMLMCELKQRVESGERG